MVPMVPMASLLTSWSSLGICFSTCPKPTPSRPFDKRRCLMQFFDQVAWCLDPKKWGKVMKSQDFSALETSLVSMSKMFGTPHTSAIVVGSLLRMFHSKAFFNDQHSPKKGGNKHNKPPVNLLNLWPSLTTDYLPTPKKRSTAMKAYLLHCLLHGYNFPLLIVHHLTRWGSGQGIHHGSATNQWLHVATTNKKDILSWKRKCQGFSNLTKRHHALNRVHLRPYDSRCNLDIQVLEWNTANWMIRLVIMLDLPYQINHMSKFSLNFHGSPNIFFKPSTIPLQWW